jgi:hypothetical protein
LHGTNILANDFLNDQSKRNEKNEEGKEKCYFSAQNCALVPGELTSRDKRTPFFSCGNTTRE